MSAPVGSIGHDDPRLLTGLGPKAAWLDDAGVQARLGAILFYQEASWQPASIPANTGQIVQIDNPLFGATLLADIGHAGDPVTRILADAARGQEHYLAFAAAIPEWCENRIYQLSSGPRVKSPGCREIGGSADAGSSHWWRHSGGSRQE